MSDRAAEGLALRFRHLAGELRRASGHADAKREFRRLWGSMATLMLDAYKRRRLPKPFLDEIDRDIPSFIKIDHVVDLTIPSRVVGYTEPIEELLPDVVKDDGTIVKGNRFVYLKPGSITSVWPGMFEDIWCADSDDDPERVIDYYWGHKFRNDADIERIIKTAVDNNRFQIIGYHATACDLLAEWIENHADDDQGDPIPPGDGLQCDDTIFVWGGKTYTNITPAMGPLLKVLMRAYRSGRDATLPEFEAVSGEIKDGFGRCFDIGKHPNRSKHPVWKLINGGRGKYRLIDPVKAK